MPQHSSNTISITTPSDVELVLSRTFRCSAALLFDAWTKCDHFSQWYGPTGWTVPHCEMDLRPQGHWKVTMRSPDGSMEMSHGGEYSEVDRPYRVTFTEAPEGPMLEMMGTTTVTLEFEESAELTTMSRTSVFESREKRDAMLQSGATDGWEQSFLRLDQHLADAE